MFAAANFGGIGYFRSDDAGVNWVKINDASHGFGSASSNCLAADPRIYGRYGLLGEVSANLILTVIL